MKELEQGCVLMFVHPVVDVRPWTLHPNEVEIDHVERFGGVDTGARARVSIPATATPLLYTYNASSSRPFSNPSIFFRPLTIEHAHSHV